jgi:hypothetical protein
MVAATVPDAPPSLWALKAHAACFAMARPLRRVYETLSVSAAQRPERCS